MFNDTGIKLKEVQDFVYKACAGSALGMNGISYKLYKNCPCVLKKLTVLLQQVWKKGIVPQKWCRADGIWIPKEMQSKGIKFSSNVPPKPRGEIFFCTPYDNLSNEQLLYKYICGARGVMVIVVGTGHGDTSSNPRRD